MCKRSMSLASSGSGKGGKGGAHTQPQDSPCDRESCEYMSCQLAVASKVLATLPKDLSFRSVVLRPLRHRL